MACALLRSAYEKEGVPMRSRRLVVSCLVLASVAATGCAATWGTTPSSTTNTTSAGADSREVIGRIVSYTTTAKGHMDGFVLDTGNRVHFPDNAGAALLPLVQKSEEVRVVGKLSDGPDGKVIEASSITNVAKRKTVNVASVAGTASQSPQRSAPRPPATTPAAQLPSGDAVPPGKSQPTTLTGAELTSKEGKVKGYTTAPSGDMDGITLDTGSRIHFPVHAGKAILPLVQQGKTVRVIGWEITGPEGAVIQATKIIATPSGETVDIDELPLPPKK